MEKNRGNETYFISNSGNEKADGTRNNPFRFFSQVTFSALNAGDTLFLMGGEVFEMSVVIDSLLNGTKEKPVVITSFGNEPAVIRSGDDGGLHLYHSRYVKIERIRLTGSGRKDGNTQDGLQLNHCSHIVLSGIEVEGYQKSGLNIYSSAEIVADGIYAHDNGFSGITVSGEYGRKESSRNILIRNSKAENNPGDPTNQTNHSGNGIVVGNCRNVIIEYCTATNNGWDMPRVGNGPVGIWAYEADSVLIQYCISYGNKTQKGAADGGGYDLDGGVTNSVIQYCLSYENEGAGYGLFQYAGASPWYNNTVRFCVSENDGNVSNGMGGFFLWNGSDDPEQLKDCYIYNNTTYNEHGGALCYEPSSLNKGFCFYNNIFVGKNDLIKGKESSGIYEGNCWYSLDAKGFNFGGVTDFESWVRQSGKEYAGNRITGLNLDPQFKNPGKTNLTDPYQLKNYDNYRLSSGSPLLTGGVDLSEKIKSETVGTDINGENPGTGLIGACQNVRN
jgi:hypothetical protein